MCARTRYRPALRRWRNFSLSVRTEDRSQLLPLFNALWETVLFLSYCYTGVKQHRLYCKMSRDPTHNESCGVCAENAGEKEMPYGVLFQNSMWVVRHLPPPGGVVGWITVHSKRHVRNVGEMSDAEVASLGPTLRHFTRIVEELTAAPRVYMAALGESFPHFHCHLVPRYDDSPVKGWKLFLQPSEVTTPDDPMRVQAFVDAFKARLAASPPPAPPA